MDYNLAALKLLCRQLKHAKPTAPASASASAFSLAGVLFQRVWLQGILVSSHPHDPSRFLLDDGTAIIDVIIHSDLSKRDWNPGMYVMVVGTYYFSDNNLPTVKVFDLMPLKGCNQNKQLYDKNENSLHFLKRSTQTLLSISIIKAHKIVDLSPYPDREAMWYLEVIEAYKMFYQPLLD